MSFALFLCGPRVTALAEIAPGIVEEIAGRGIASQVVTTAPTTADGAFHVPAAELGQRLEELAQKDAAAVILLPECDRDAREALIAQAREPVVVDWCRSDDDAYQRTQACHCEITDEDAVLDGMAQVFAVLEGLGHLPFAERGALTPEQDAELVEKLKELGYV